MPTPVAIQTMQHVVELMAWFVVVLAIPLVVGWILEFRNGALPKGIDLRAHRARRVRARGSRGSRWRRRLPVRRASALPIDKRVRRDRRNHPLWS